jgi:ubiquinone/menaquinone biosynthesis C-methylase UbiE
VEFNPEKYYESLDAIFSEAAPVYDQKIQANFINVDIREKEVKSVRERYIPGWRLLEIGCGTGEEAKKIISETGCDLTCVDISKGMIEFATTKIQKSGNGDKFRAFRLPASSLGMVDGKFGIVYSFNGALNNEPNLSKFFKALGEIVLSGGYFIVSVRNRLSLGEILADCSRLRLEKLFSRIRGNVNVEVVGKKVSSHYFTNSEFLKLVPSGFRLEESIGLGIFAIPSLYEKIRPEDTRSFLRRLESVFSGFPLINHLGDETLFVFKKI